MAIGKKRQISNGFWTSVKVHVSLVNMSNSLIM